MPYDPNAQRAMRLGPSYKYGDQLEMGYEDPPSSYIVPPFESNTGPVDERTRMMLEALEHFGNQSRMPHLNPDIPFPDPEGRLRGGGEYGEGSDIGELDQYNAEGDVYDMLMEKRTLYPLDDPMRDVYNPGMHPDAAQEMMKQILEGYLNQTGRR